MTVRCKYGVLGEDISDAETIRALVRLIGKNSKVPVKLKGYGGAPAMRRKGKRDLRTMCDLGCTHFVIVYDADRNPSDEVRKEVIECIVRPAEIKKVCCILVPVQEIEAWILADINAVQNVIIGWKPTSSFDSPEKISEPKELLERLSRASNRKPRYSHATHNPRVARHLDWRKVQKKCPSFRPLVDFVLQGKGNFP